MEFREGEIEGVGVRDLKFYHDTRGWLSEIFRHDEIDKDIHPVMAYVSMTSPGMQRGPHEHVDQTDYFAFFSSSFRVVMWDARKDSPTYMNRMTLIIGEREPKCVIIPPGVVHGYRNVGDADGLVINFPNRLFAGWGRKEPVDEARYEGRSDSPYRMDE
jgi:dTDP-4-dehydrorhamnose 3,5-epimerase